MHLNRAHLVPIPLIIIPVKPLKQPNVKNVRPLIPRMCLFQHIQPSRRPKTPQTLQRHLQLSQANRYHCLRFCHVP